MTTRILIGDVRDRLKDLPDASVQCVITSPPYFNLRDYGTADWSGGDAACDHLGAPKRTQDGFNERYFGKEFESDKQGDLRQPYRSTCGKCGAVRIDRQIGLEPTLSEYIASLVAVFREVKRVLRDDGVVFLNLGDSYAGSWGNQGRKEERGTQRPINGPMMQPLDDRYPANGSNTGAIRDPGLKPKDLMMVPARVAIALQDDGWYLRSEIIWAKPNPMPESVTDRPTSAHEKVYLLSKKPTYFYDADAIREENASPEQHEHNQRYAKQYDAYDSRAGATGQPGNVNNVGIHARPGKAGRNKRNVWTISTQPFSGWTPTVRRHPVALDAIDDDTWRRPSEGCQVHAWTGRSDPIRVGDERATGVSIRTSDTYGGPGRAQPDGSAPTDLSLGGDWSDESSDSPLLPCAASATPHSTQSRRTDRDPATSPAYTPCVGMLTRTDDTSTQPASAAPHPGTPESSTSSDDSDGDPSPGTSGRTAHTSSGYRSFEACSCSYYRETTESISHFATFPPKLVEPMILAGTSAKGCCPACGSPWVRVVERVDTGEVQRKGAGWDTGEGAHGSFHRNGRAPVVEYAPVTATQTTGWSPGCVCPAADPVPCTVLDPFGGAGTVALEADRLGRDAILIELNESYARMAEQRITGAAPMFAVVEVA
jgi:DNA modification methylase